MVLGVPPGARQAIAYREEGLLQDLSQRDVLFIHGEHLAAGCVDELPNVSLLWTVGRLDQKPLRITLVCHNSSCRAIRILGFRRYP